LRSATRRRRNGAGSPAYAAASCQKRAINLSRQDRKAIAAKGARHELTNLRQSSGARSRERRGFTRRKRKQRVCNALSRILTA
jgi:hypothetical protein